MSSVPAAPLSLVAKFTGARPEDQEKLAPFVTISDPRTWTVGLPRVRTFSICANCLRDVCRMKGG
jgi:hypothetical protein